MQQVDNQAGSPSHEPSHSFGRVARSYFLKEWPNAVLVAAVVFIIHHYFHWLEAVDGYAFMGIGQFGFVATPKRSEQVIALLIDRDTHETRYRERSPLSRCALYDDLLPLYEAKPDLVAIDIDISPAIWTLSPRKLKDSSTRGQPANPANVNPWQSEIECEKQLYCLIESAALNWETTTVIMTPFDVSTSASDLGQLKNDWQKRMETAGVKFGHAHLPVEYGLVIKRHTDPESFVGRARIATLSAHQSQQHEKKTDHIDPRQYARVKPILISDLDKMPNAKDYLSEVLGKTKAFDASKAPPRVAFFGAAYGKDDLFMTPIGEVYGVEAQAASYLSEGLSEHKGRDFLVDIALAIGFGIWIAYCWSGYFNARFSNNARHRQLARLWIIIGLIPGVGLMIFGVTAISLVLLAYFGIWASPIPIAVGMLFDSFVSGSIDQAVHSSEHAKQSLVTRLKAIATEPAVRLTLDQESHQQSHEPKNLFDSLRRVFGGDFLGLWRRRKFLAAGMLSAWSVVWLFFTGWAIKICFTH